MVKAKGELGQVIYHMQGMSPFLTIDINTQPLSRNPVNSALTRGIDDATVLFDKANVVQFVDRKLTKIDLGAKRTKLQMFYEQIHPSIIKNIRRNKPLEALYYYQLVLRYATKFLWLKYGMPEKKEYDLKHIYRTVPTIDLEALQMFYDVPSGNIEATLPKLKDWLHSL